MARVGDELSLAREPGLEASEHLVQRLAEAADLVAASGSGRRRPEISVETSAAWRRIASTGRRAERASDVARERGEEDGERADDQKLGEEAVEGLLLLVERRADDQDARVDPRGEEARGILERWAARARDEEIALESPRGLLGGRSGSPSTTGEDAARLPSGARSCANPSSPVASSSPAPVLDDGRERPGAQDEALVELLLERVPEPDVEERAEPREDDRHREREDERQAERDRNPAHAPSARRR